MEKKILMNSITGIKGSIDVNMYEVTSVFGIAIDLCDSNVPVATKRIRTGGANGNFNRTCAAKIGDNVLSSIFAAKVWNF